MGASRHIVRLEDTLCTTEQQLGSGYCSCSGSSISDKSEIRAAGGIVAAQAAADAVTGLQPLGWQGSGRQRNLVRRLLSKQSQKAAGGAAQQAAAAWGDAGSSAGVSKQEDRRCQAVAAYWKSHGKLSHVVIRDAGHMPPHDVPRTAQYMIERWLGEVVAGSEAGGA